MLEGLRRAASMVNAKHLELKARGDDRQLTNGERLIALIRAQVTEELLANLLREMTEWCIHLHTHDGANGEMICSSCGRVMSKAPSSDMATQENRE